MGKVRSSEAAGSIIRRVREDRGLSRAALATQTGIGARTLYALEQGESPNFGLGNYLKLLDVLGLSMFVEYDGNLPASKRPPAASAVPVPEYELGDLWKLDDEEPR
ncbi:MAG: helix-turn-helix domain-containing protein [Coriobacteriales bacterium]